MEFTMELTIAFLAFLAVVKGVKFVPQQQVWIVERMGRYRASMQAGLNFLIPFIDNISYRHSLKEEAVDIPSQTAITKDNVTLIIDGILYLKITDPKQASYGVGDARYAITQMAQTTMRSELGKMTLDRTFLERDNLNVSIVQSINEASVVWGIQCLRYEIKDITPPDNVRQAMELQVAAERKKRAEVLDSEGKRQSQINIAEGIKQEVVLKSEAAMTDQINRAKGEAEAILQVAKATAEGIEMVAASIDKSGGEKAVALRLAEQYIEAFSKLAKENNTLILPAKTDDAGSMVAQALSIFNSIQGQMKADKKDIS
ncbi:MAG TPA: paraslipin [Nitrospina sp.]|jgi:regulator of protease activity HflC (stomatin/prohibitin superfamily)|nr:paraslipin [Nitrospina sp.]|tara:strand:- start:3337 stop:4281 length:945 start_codon:yes stop_codon:yes gene_type:complete